MATKPRSKRARTAKTAGRAAKSRAAARKGGPAKTYKNKAKPKAPAGSKVKPKAKSKAKAIATAKARVPERRKQKSLRLRSLSPSFTVNDLERSLLFYVEALGFTLQKRWEQDGRLMGVMLLAGNCELGIGQDDWAKGRDRVKGVGFRLYAETVQDLDQLAERIRAHGFTAEGPKAESWGATTVTVTDPDGFKITFQEVLK
jgi:uncharacterized glyoxalase superfamily protein PhnB